MARLVNMTPANQPKATPIWGFGGRCNRHDIANAVVQIAAGLKGDNHVIHIMSGTHGCCTSGPTGAVSTREERFADEDRSLADPKTSDRKPVALVVHDFNTENTRRPEDPAVKAEDPRGLAMARLNQAMQAIDAKKGNTTSTYLLGYCCSAAEL